ncbi:MAG TPA: hypothetical protein DCZ12_11280 [Gammaproteobacteria bacterium]|nr:hypothetical protein [Gammaproteobacteria bacterium]
MQTECPNCGTIFRLSPAHLSRPDKRVRCSLCLTVFNADVCLVDSETPASNPEWQQPPSPPGENLGKPQNYPQDYPGNNTRPETEKQDDIPRGLVPYNTPPISKPDDVDADMPDFLRARTAQKTTSKPLFLWKTTFVVAFVCLVAQLTYHFKDTLASNPQLRPMLQQLCEYTGCELQPLRDLNAIKLVKRNIYSHPNAPGILIISATFINRAPFSQPYPKILISMANLQGTPVAERIFSPGEYSDTKKELMPPGTTTTIILNVRDPGQSALTFELDFV